MKKEVGHSFWGIIDTAVYPMIYMAVVPLLMENLGSDGFGLWILINSLMVILQLFNLNIGITTIKELAGISNSKAKQRLNALLTIVLIMLILVGIVGILIGFLAEKFNFFGLSDAPVRSVFECFALAGLISGLKFLDQLFHGTLKAKELIKESAFLNIFNKVGLLAIIVFLAIKGFDITALLYGNVVFSLINLLIMLLVISRFYKGYFPALSKDRLMIKGLFKFSMWPWLQSLFVVIAFQTDRFWVSSYAGLDEVANYGLIATIFNHIHLIFSAMFIWVLPRVSAMANNALDPFPFYQRIRSIFSLFVLLSLLAFYFLSPYLFPLWIGDEHYQNMKAYLQLFVVFELLFSHTIMPYFYMNATGREKQITYLTGFYCFLSYAMMLIALITTHSIIWMIGGMAVSMFISMPVLNYYVRNGNSDKNKIHELRELIPAFSAVGLVLLPMPWSLLLTIPILYRIMRTIPMFYQIKRNGKVFSFGK